MDPFAMALDVLFYAPGSDEAFYTPKGGAERAEPIRVIRGQPDRAVGFAGQQVIEGTNVFEIRKSDVAVPARGDVVRIGGNRFKLLGEAMDDVEGLSSTIGGSPVA
jgi:RNase P/RNase MRP subunit p29